MVIRTAAVKCVNSRQVLFEVLDCFHLLVRIVLRYQRFKMLITGIFSVFVTVFVCAVLGDECQPHTWKRAVGDVVCQYTASSPATVNYYTCMGLAKKYGITIETFFKLNPTIDPDCIRVTPNTEYCVRGCMFNLTSLGSTLTKTVLAPLVAVSGSCGPNHQNASCIGTDFQCCNSRTWKCGNSE